MTSIAYQGIAHSTVHVPAIIEKVREFALSYGWKIERNALDFIVVTPHRQCESIVIAFDQKLRFSGVTKTVYSPVEIHHQISEFFFAIKPLLKRLRIDDDTGYWDAFLEERLNKKSRELVIFPDVKQDKIITEQLFLSKHATLADKEFWTYDYDNRDSYFENRILLHYPTIRNLMGYDLANGRGFAFIADDIVVNLEKEGFVSYDSEFFQMYHSRYFNALAILWAWRNSIDKPTETKRNRCFAFAHALENGVEGGEQDGYSGKLHREASLALDILLEKEGPASPYRSLQIFYALFDFCHLKRKPID
ncbi:hypothetical protein [Paenibacillus sp. PL2-23]|uniref:hypothetical protein n=1 Tax=Paenibacillus sp. PL2-23 TaxID=2100729 RepID=UPI0030F70B13